MAMSLHVAFLRGVGAARPTPGDALRACLGAAGYDRVRPVIATGNVIFGLGRKRKPPEEAALGAILEAHFGYPLPAILRTGDSVAAMVAAEPFPKVDERKAMRFVALLAADAPPAEAFAEPKPGDGYRLVERGERDLLFLVDRESIRTVDLMARLEKAFLKRLTTRNWNTIEKVAAALAKA